VTSQLCWWSHLQIPRLSLYCVGFLICYNLAEHVRFTNHRRGINKTNRLILIRDGAQRNHDVNMWSLIVISALHEATSVAHSLTSHPPFLLRSLYTLKKFIHACQASPTRLWQPYPALIFILFNRITIKRPSTPPDRRKVSSYICYIRRYQIQY
jgi:hypothetical protein